MNINNQEGGEIRTEFKIVKRKNKVKIISDKIQELYQKYTGICKTIGFLSLIFICLFQIVITIK